MIRPLEANLRAALFSVCLAVFAASSSPAAEPVRTLEVGKNTPKLEVRFSQIGYRDTLLFYTFPEQKSVLKLRIDNRDKKFPATATFYVFADDVTEEGIKKWLNNQHSDGLYPEVPEPIHTQLAPKDVCQVTDHKFIDSTAQPFGTFDNYAVTFKVADYTDEKTVKLSGFSGETKVHVKTK